MDQEEFATSSPVQPKNEIVSAVNFFEALKEVAAGKRVTKFEWGNNKIYGILTDGQLKLMLDDGLLHPWTISDGDLNGTDWIVLE